MSEPDCRRYPKTEFTNDLIFRAEDITNVHGIILSSFKLFETFLLQYLSCTDSFKTARSERQGTEGSRAKKISAPS